MAKSLEQVVAEGLIADCSSLEELYVLWQTVHHMEEDGARETCYKEIDQRSFHIDGILCPQDFSGVLYLLKEPSLRSDFSGDYGYTSEISEEEIPCAGRVRLSYGNAENSFG